MNEEKKGFSVIRNLLRKYKTFILYCLVGGVNTLLDFCVYTLLNYFTQLDVHICQALGYVSGVICSFILNRNVTFRKNSRTGDSQFLQAVRFLVVNGVTLVSSMLIIDGLVSLGLNEYIAKLPTQLAVVVINYLGYKLFVFGEKK